MDPDILKQAILEMSPRSEQRLHDLILIALCAPMGRVRREYNYSTHSGYYKIEKLAEVYP